jgi:subtilisin family serine protease
LNRVIACILVFCFLQIELNSQSSESQHLNDHVPNEVLCLFKTGVNIDTVLAEVNIESHFKFYTIERLSEAMNLWKIGFSGDDDTEALMALSRDESVQIVQFNHTNLSVRSIPNDTLFYRQWAFLNDGSNGGTGLADIDAKLAWDISIGGISPLGDTIVVAVIDQGFDVDHVDLIENMFVNRGEIHGNNVDDDGNGFVDDRQGWDFYNDDPYHPNNNHGTHVAGTIGAKGNNEIGVTGVNWDVKILPVTGSSTLESTVIQAYAYILGLRRMYNQTNGELGAYIVATNSSFGVDEGQPVDYPLWCAMYDSLGAQGILSAGATANDNINIDEVGDVPTACASNFLISVTNTRSTDEINNNAGFGIETIDLGAPGTGVYSTFSNNNYGNSTGTSMATPHVAGTVGLMYSAICPDVLQSYGTNYPGLALFIKDKLLDEGVDEVTGLTGLVKTGGRLNLNKSIRSVSDLCVQVVFNAVESECDSCNGRIKASILGGSSSVQYLWNTGSSADSIINLCPGIYTLTAIDGSDTLIKSYALSDNTGPDLTIESNDISCAGLTDGSIDVSGGFNYSWSDASSVSNRSNLEQGLYYLTATDSLGVCTTTAIASIAEPEPLTAEFEFILPSNQGGSDGQLTATPVGGIYPYSFNWQTGDTTASILNQTEGIYAITVSDANGCEFQDSARLGYPLTTEPIISENLNVRIWPNPVSDNLFIESDQDIQCIKLIDVQGRTVLYHEPNNLKLVDLNMRNVESGVYIVSISLTSGAVLYKSIISHEVR